MNMEEFCGPLDEKILQSIEEFWGFGLPEDYRNFLKYYNGGIPREANFSFKGQIDGSVISQFYGFIRGAGNIMIVAKDMGLRYLDYMLPIADDVFGNQILITVKGPDRGKVYFWDHEMESGEGEEPDYSNLTLIADSFKEFIDNLKDEREIKGL